MVFEARISQTTDSKKTKNPYIVTFEDVYRRTPSALAYFKSLSYRNKTERKKNIDVVKLRK